MARFALHLFKDFPPRFVAMEELFAHLPLMQGLPQWLKQPRYSLQSIRERALGQGQAVMPQLLTEAVGGTAIEVFVQQDHRHTDTPKGLFGISRGAGGAVTMP